ncbi:unnamed protein product, partial [Porites evermanni]
ADFDDEDFDLIQPSLIQQLRKILDEYPDDGQVLKELIQNAEDAGATQVKFLHDKHSYGTDELYNDELAKFQGPALYAYNNSKFSKEDWRGIRLVCDSIKVEDPMKVGRFGLGFKSVFHMTDLPSLISDSRIGFIDPHGVHFPDRRRIRTGKYWRLDEDRASIDEFSDQFLPYKGIFNCTDEVFSQGFYDGTLFRFPFRRERSDLSETLYNEDKMRTLFDSFKADASLILLFLQSLESVELYTREESDSSPSKIFQVKIAEKSLQTVRAKRKEFRKKITPGKVMPEPVTVSYPMTIETTNFETHLTEKHSFFVTNYFCGGQVSSTFKKLMTDKVLSYLPTVGVAMALPDGPQLQTPDIQGHVFCFLPLPVQTKSLTGLPVHVNGFFALSQNRRYIKSPNADQEERQKTGRKMTDKSLLWNKCLLEEALPKAYTTMILEAINEKSVFISKTAIYKAWPDIKSINKQWEGLEEPLFQLLLAKNVVHTEAKGGNWLAVSEALFQRRTDGEQLQLLQKVLLSIGAPTVTAPSHVLRALDAYALNQNEITPSLIRHVLRKVPLCYTRLDKTEKLLLLQFCLSDRAFKDLASLQLLPLANGTFAKFDSSATTVYITSPEHPQELFPGTPETFLQNDLDEDILQRLTSAASEGHTQLQLLRSHHVPELLEQSLPQDWKKGDSVLWYPDSPSYHHPSRAWIKSLWNYLQRHFMNKWDIRQLEGLPLIPLSMSQTPVTLTRLSRPSRIVVKQYNEESIDENLANVLKRLEIIVLHDLPTFISYHPAVMGTYVNAPTVQGVLKAMMTMKSTLPPGSFSEILQRDLSKTEKLTLRSFLANISSFDIEKEVFLCSLPIFETLYKRFVSKNDGLKAAPAEALPVPPPQDLIDISNDDSWTLAQILKVRILQPIEVICEIIFPGIHEGNYDEDQIDEVMLYVFERFTHMIRKNANFKWQLQALAFVPKQTERVRASDVFDPRDTTLKKIFAQEDVFPAGEMYTDPATLVILEVLGMKDESNISAKDLFHSVKQVNRIAHHQTARQKSKAILYHLNNHPKKLKKKVDGTELGLLLMKMQWVPRLQQKQSSFPPSLPWFKTEKGAECFFKPTELKSPTLVNLIGSVRPVVELEPLTEVFEYFGWQKLPDVFDVALQLRNVISFYSKDEKPYYMVILNEIYSYLSRANYQALSLVFQQMEIVNWVWNGDGFSSPYQVLSGKLPFDLTPYVHPLPSETMKFSLLFERFGVRTHTDPNVLLQVLYAIKEKYDAEVAPLSTYEVYHDLQLSVGILNELAQEELPPDIQERIVIPVYTENKYVLLEPVERCMYSENRDWLANDGEDEDMEYLYVHPDVPSRTAQRLGVPSLTNRMLEPEELYIGEEFGQEEKLTTRLNRLLEDYTDGFAVPKELIQNADDAGATEVRFLYDERTNEDAKTCLIDEGMKGCQGPALWVYNDATFKDEDFVNITRLNEATKAHDTAKIGRFGLGFNAVYNLTDVPMFVSRNYLAIFDPHTSFLGKAIRNIRRPGMKINLNKDVKRLKKFKNQLKPFYGVFGCDLRLEKQDNSFDGTLFRFPLRTEDQASASEIKKLWYNQEQMRELLQMFLHGAENVLLFTQNVLSVGIYHLPNTESQDPQPTLMFQVTKSASHAGILRELSFTFTLPPTAFKLTPEEMSFLQQCNFLQASSKSKMLARGKKVDPKKLPKSSMIVDVECRLTKSGSDFFHDGFHSEKATWLIVSSMGNGQALKFANDDPCLLPSAGAAVQLLPTESNTFCPSPVAKTFDGLDLKGTIFCYLPLPIHSGLPVHINGAFALASNRRHLQMKLEDDKSCYGVEWNNVLLLDSVTSALLDLLEDMKGIAPKDGSYKFHCLWPKTSEVHRNCFPLVLSFYTQLSRGGYFLFSNGEHWADITQVIFLDPSFRKKPYIGEAANDVLKMCHRGREIVIDLPADILQSFENCRLEKAIGARKYSKKRFFREVFFPNVHILPANVRDVLTLHALDDRSGEFYDLIRRHPCVPSAPFGKTLMTPSELVHPYGEAASLFSPEDGRFPYGNEESYAHRQRLSKLVQLGMLSNDLPWSDLTERAQSIQKLNSESSNEALTRIKALLSFMEKKLIRQEKPTSQISARLLNTKFLPILQKPREFPLHWKGEELVENSQVLLAPNEAFLEEKKYLVCCTVPLIGVSVPKEVRSLLDLDKKGITLDQVVHQLTAAVSTKVDLLSASEYKELSLVCTSLYSCLQNSLARFSDEIVAYLQGTSFILVGRRFLSANQVAFTLPVDCSPYLFQITHELALSFTPLLKAAGVKTKFDEQDYISSLQKIKEQAGQQPLDNQNLQVAIHIAKQLSETLDVTRTNRQLWEVIYVPNSKGIMHPVSELCIRDCSWLPDEEGVNFINDNIPLLTSRKLGVKTRKQEALRPRAYGIPFGQREKLANRLKRILTGYPCEKEILKELLQNADDAQATEVWFIKDPRHHPDERVFEDIWKPLQGPALCVYNNKPFRNEDIEGIRNLGEGSKGDDPNKTGQYGVGFNAVYHLTDVPSFITKGKDIGEVLCAFDPNCRYVPGATPQEPGMRFEDIPYLRKQFPDVFPCYLENHFQIENGTMFRFPLRTRQMSMNSLISNRLVTFEMLDTMLEDLRKELFEVLLFVNNVKKITICEVHKNTGELVNFYSVETAMSKEDETEKQTFCERIKKVGTYPLPSDIPAAKVSYVLNISDSFLNQEKWFIVQQMGFQKAVKKSIVNAFKRKELGMLPRGGVACILEKNSKDNVERRKKAYCFLPLPFETDLPVHINAHFALDHEARRNLWRDEGDGYRSDWNNALLGDVVASCYLTLLTEVRAFLKLPVSKDGKPCTLTCSEGEILQSIKAYESIFPLKPLSDPYWETLVDSLYAEMASNMVRVLPVIRNKISNAVFPECESRHIVELSWFPPVGQSKRQEAFFNDLAENGPFARLPQRERNEPQTNASRTFEEILLESGFNLVAFSLNLHKTLTRSGIPACTVTPRSVVDFYKSLTSRDPLCKIGSIPCYISETPFRDTFGLILVLLYCKGMANFTDHLPGLPLLLTQDSCLRLFSTEDPKFFSRFHDILPGSPHVFVHMNVDQKVFNEPAKWKSSLVRPLDVEGFSAHLAQTLELDRYGKGRFVEWSWNQDGVPNQRWISRVWIFLSDLFAKVLRDESLPEQTKCSQIKSALGSLANWSILPATESKIEARTSPFLPFSIYPTSTQFLVPLSKATAVLDYRSSDASSNNLLEVLKKLGVPELNYAVLSNLSSAIRLAPYLVSSLKIPSSLLTAIRHKIEKDPQSPERLDSKDCRTILEYFSKSAAGLHEADKSKLKKLPFFLATHGGFVPLDNDCRVCVLPVGIPRKEMEILERHRKLVFIESWAVLSNLFKFLDLECVSAVDVYCTYILPTFHIFSQEGRLVHLEYIRKHLLSEFAVDNDMDKQRLRNCLETTPFIPSIDGTLQTASSFYDPDVDVFRIILPPTTFPSKPLNSPEWLMVLRTIGLIHEVSHDHFNKFAREVAHEAIAAQTARTFEKSRVLVKHLFHRHNVVGEGLLPSIAEIPFVSSEPARKGLREVSLPYQGMADNQIPFCAFKGAVPAEYAEIVWTQARLLPRWADPMACRRELSCPHKMRIENYCNSFASQLQIVAEPSLELVVRHCQAVCHSHENNDDSNIPSPEKRTTLKAVMERIYEFLQTKLNTGNDVRSLLVNTPCVLVEQGKKFILPRQAVLQLYEHLEIKPFLYSLPQDFGKFHPLFQALGCSKYVSIAHYAMVLQMLYLKSNNDKLHPNEIRACVKAVKGFFQLLEESEEELSSFPQLYLPGISFRGRSLEEAEDVIRVTLQQSSHLVFCDVPPSFLDRLQNFDHLLLDLKSMKVTCSSAMTNYKELVMKLPTKLRPKMLSSLVKETISSKSEIKTISVAAVNSLKHKLTCPQFIAAIVRLIRDENQNRKDIDDDVIAKVESRLRGIDICVVENLQSVLVCDNSPVQGSQKRVSSLVESSVISDEEKWTVYLDLLSVMSETLPIYIVSDVIVLVLEGLLGNRALMIPRVLNCDPSDISALLDALDVRPDDSYVARAEVDIYPKLGTFIPVIDHHLLNDAFEEFEPGEYVGFELEDPTLNHEKGVPTYIYARVVREVTEERLPLLTKRYKIDIGGGQELEVDVADLYKFHRLSTLSSAIVIFEGQERRPPERPKRRNQQEVFDEISKLLEDAWKLPEEKRRKIIKRLYLQWHPDKNVGDEEFCTEVCKHIQSETSRLERGEPRGCQQSSGMGSSRSQHGSYGQFFNCWGERAREHHTQREGYRSRQQFSRNSARARNPQPREARRWLRQAEADIAATENDIVHQRPFYEWACFKCHQV